MKNDTDTGIERTFSGIQANSTPAGNAEIVPTIAQAVDAQHMRQLQYECFTGNVTVFTERVIVGIVRFRRTSGSCGFIENTRRFCRHAVRFQVRKPKNQAQ